MLRHTMRLGDQLVVGNHVIHLVEIYEPNKINIIVAPVGQSFVIEHRRRRRHAAKQPIVKTPYHPEVETMLKG